MSTSELLSIIAQEEASLASILSAEAVKAGETARWITLISDDDTCAAAPWRSNSKHCRRAEVRKLCP